MGYRYVAAFESIKNHEFSSLSISLIALVERLYCRRNNSEASMTKIRRRIHKVHERASVKSPSFLSRFPRRPNKFLSLASNFSTIIDYGDSEKEREKFARVAKNEHEITRIKTLVPFILFFSLLLAFAVQIIAMQIAVRTFPIVGEQFL